MISGDLQGRLARRLSGIVRAMKEALVDIQLAEVSDELTAEIVNSILHEDRWNPDTEKTEAARWTLQAIKRETI